MPTIATLQYENANALTSFPFSDNASMTDTSGRLIGTRVFVDGKLYPIVPDQFGIFYISRISDGVIYLSYEDRIIATGSTDESNGREIFFHDMSRTHRFCGSMLLGINVDEFNLFHDRTFEKNALPLSPLCAVPITSYGITSISFYDINRHELPYLVICGNTRVRLRLNTVGNKHDICMDRMDVLNVPHGHSVKMNVLSYFYSEILDGISTIVFEFNDETPFFGSSYENGILLSTAYSQDDVCSNSNVGRERNPDAITDYDACEADEEKTPPDISPPIISKTPKISIDANRLYHGSLTIGSPSTPSYVNPIHISIIEPHQTGIKYNILSSGIDMLDEAMNKSMKDDRVGGGIMISIPGAVG